MKKTANLICITLLLFQCIILLINYSRLPSQIAIHLNLKGEVDNYGPKWVLIFIVFLSIILFILFKYIRKRPEKFNYPFFNTQKKDVIYTKSQVLIDYLNILTMLIFTYVLLLFIFFYDYDITNLVIILYVLIFLPILFVLYYLINLYKISKK